MPTYLYPEKPLTPTLSHWEKEKRSEGEAGAKSVFILPMVPPFVGA